MCRTVQKYWGASSIVVVVICPLLRIGLTDLPKTGGGGGNPPPSTPASLHHNLRLSWKMLHTLKARIVAGD